MAGLKLGLVGGGPGSMIGPVHRRGATLDGAFELVAGAVSSDPAKQLPGIRNYPSLTAMLSAERELDAVAIMTPNHVHHEQVMAALEAGLDIICDKPLANTADHVAEIWRAAEARKAVFCITHTYAGYPMVRQARAMVKDGQLGALRMVQVEYLGSGIAAKVEEQPDFWRRWRLDPAKGGASMVLGDLGTHAHHLVAFVTGQPVVAVRGEVGTVMPGRIAQDWADLSIRLADGTRGSMFVTAAATGMENHIAIRVVGEKATLEWSHGAHNHLTVRHLDGPPQTYARGGSYLSEAAKRAIRIPRLGHPEGIHEAFANLYGDAAEAIRAKRAGQAADPLALDFPTHRDGARGVWFVAAALESSARGHGWVDCRLEP